MTDGRWHGFDCDNPRCPGGLTAGGDGVVLDVRLVLAVTACSRPAYGDVRSHDDPPEIRCPLCNEIMRHRGHWEANEAGYGSRGDADAASPVSRLRAALHTILALSADREKFALEVTAAFAAAERIARDALEDSPTAVAELRAQVRAARRFLGYLEKRETEIRRVCRDAGIAESVVDNSGQRTIRTAEEMVQALADGEAQREAQHAQAQAERTQAVTSDELLRVPGDLLPGLLDDWYGVAERVVDGFTVRWSPLGVMAPEHARYRLPLSRWEARAHLVRYLAARVPCPNCGGRGRYADEDGCDLPESALECATCHYNIPPHDLTALLDWPHNGIKPHESAAMLGASARLVAEGLAPVRAALGPWQKPCAEWFREAPDGTRSLWVGEKVRVGRRDGWSCNWYEVGEYAAGDETGEAGKARADAAALAHRFALLDTDPDRITVPTPDGPVTVEAP